MIETVETSIWEGTRVEKIELYPLIHINSHTEDKIRVSGLP